VVQVNVSAQLVPARVKSTDGHKSASGSRRPSLEVPTGDAAALNMNGLPSSAATTPSIGTEWEIKVEVVDQGIGISDAEIGNLFQSFRQAKKVQMAFGGTGLGLAISRSVKHDTCLLDATSAGVLTRCRQRSQHEERDTRAGEACMVALRLTPSAPSCVCACAFLIAVDWLN
jgi:hypothetical protein